MIAAGDGVLRAMIVDDEPLAIERMQVLCAELDQLQVVGTASDGEGRDGQDKGRGQDSHWGSSLYCVAPRRGLLVAAAH